ncbi:virulence factor TspB C-terminal domain-related protein [Ralstonia pseudosolanacearum]|uniref:virulence factor TspB C-terminal domain-related protein n=1 Tax=Ralstonia pseudosolanacearum TaxID=1310165 RepID=UPI003CF5E04C
MRVLVLLLCWWASSAWASTIPLIPPPNIVLTGTGYVTTGAVTLSEVATATEIRAAVGAGAATIAATMTLGEGAAAVALAALRAMPAIATATTLAYLAQIGIQKCLDGTWCTSKLSANSGDLGFNGYQWRSCAGYFDSPIAAGQACIATHSDAVFAGCRQGASVESYVCTANDSNGSFSFDAGVSRQSTCVTGYVVTDGACKSDPNAPKQGASDADWNKALTYPLPAAVASDMSAAKVPIPVKLTPSTTPVNVNLSDPYVDPVTGKRYRDVATVTPNSDGKTATLTTGKQEVDANGNPATDPATGNGKAPEKQDDQCSGHETRMGCIEQGEIPDGPDLKEQQVNVKVTPDSGWGADTAPCPSDLTASIHGMPISWSLKPVCDGADMFRPVIIACAWLGAALIVIGVGRKGEE